MQGKPHRWLLDYRWIKRFGWFLDRFHSVYFVGRETSRRIFVVRREIDKKAADIQARSFMARTLGENGKEMLSWRRSKNGHMKNQSSIMLDDFEEFISLTMRTRSSKKPLGMLERNWKHQWLPLCLARHARKVRNGRPVARLMISSHNLRVSWKPVNPQDCVWKNLYRITMRSILQEKGQFLQHLNLVLKCIPMPQAMKIPAAKGSSG